MKTLSQQERERIEDLYKYVNMFGKTNSSEVFAAIEEIGQILSIKESK